MPPERSRSRAEPRAPPADCQLSPSAHPVCSLPVPLVGSHAPRLSEHRSMRGAWSPGCEMLPTGGSGYVGAMASTTDPVRSPFSFDRRYRSVGRLLGVRPESAWAEVSADALDVRFGPWRVETPLANVADV